MILKVVDKGGMNYPEVVDSETGKKIDGVISISYEATASGRIFSVVFIGELDVEMKATCIKPITRGFGNGGKE